MSVFSRFSILDAFKLLPGSQIVHTWITDAFEGLCALYEGSVDAAAPGASVHRYAGHDHGFNGGSPIARGGSWSMDSGSQAGFFCESQFMGDRQSVDHSHVGIFRRSENVDSALFKFYCSPRSTGSLNAVLHFHTQNSAFELELVNETEGSNLFTKYDLPATSGESGVQWLEVEIPMVAGEWNDISLYCTNKAYDSANKPNLSIGKLIIFETTDLAIDPTGRGAEEL